MLQQDSVLEHQAERGRPRKESDGSGVELVNRPIVAELGTASLVQASGGSQLCAGGSPVAVLENVAKIPVPTDVQGLDDESNAIESTEARLAAGRLREVRRKRRLVQNA